MIHCAGSNPTYLHTRNWPSSAFEQIADGERFARFAQALPGVVFVKSFHLAPLLVIFRLDRCAARNVRRPLELLPWQILHPVDPKERHSTTF